jgi:uncharacterized membrane protein required for colicin V production
MKKLAAFIVPAAVVGIIVVYFLPWIQSMITNVQNATVQKVVGYKFVQLLIVGVVVLFGFHAAIWIAEETGVQ